MIRRPRTITAPTVGFGLVWPSFAALVMGWLLHRSLPGARALSFAGGVGIGQQRQVGAEDRLMHPFLAVRPAAGAARVGQMRVEDEGERFRHAAGTVFEDFVQVDVREQRRNRCSLR